MSNAAYELSYTDPYGVKIVDIYNFVSLEYARKQNDIGSLKLVIPSYDYSLGHFIALGKPRVDCRIEVYRKLTDGSAYLDMETAWFTRKFTIETDSKGTELYVIEAVDAIDLLDRRIIPYNEGNENLTADKVDYADDMMKEIMDENYGASASDTDRDLSDWLIVQPSISDAPSMLKSFSRRNVLSTFKDIAETSYELGTPLIFDIIYNPDSKQFEFRTYTNYRGADRSVSTGNSPVIVSDKRGTLTNVSLEYDQTSNRNYIYAGGQSIGQIRAVWEEADTDDIGLSPFNRKELFVNASDTDDDDELEDEAQHALQENRGKVSFSGTIVDTEKVRYGREYKFGYKITAEYKNQKYDVFVDAISVSVDKNGEHIDARLRSTF